MLGISADPQDKSKKVVERNKLGFDLLSDVGAKTITAYGLLYRDPAGRGDIALPANFLIDKTGKVVWRYLATHVQDRADPLDVRREVERLPR